jgi:splicing factor 3B subunit 3
VSFDTFDTLLIDIPKRSTTADNTIIISHTTHATKKSWFMLLQTEDGDLLRMNQEMKLTYFDTVPKSNSILILKSGYLICASECGDAYIYQVESLGNDDGTIEIEPRELQHISLVDKIQSLAPLTDCVVLQGETLQILTCSGMAGQSTLRSLKHGLGVEELGNSELPAIPTGVWSVDDFLVLGFVNATLVLKVGESVEEVDGTGLVTEKQTIAVGRIGDGIVQIYEKGVRFIKDGSISEWIATGKVITGCVEDKVVVVMKTQVVVFEYLDGGIVETGSIDLESSMVSCAGTFCAIVVGQSVRMLDMKKMEMVGMQVLSDNASGLEMCEDHGVLYLHIGLVNGVYVRTTVDRVTGGLGDVRQRFLGRRVKIRKIQVNHGTKVVAMSNQTWISDEKRMVPLAYESLDMVCGLDVGIVGIVGNELRILGVEMDGVFYQSELSLKYTPRRLLEYKGKVVVLEAEYGVQGQEEGGMFGRNGVVQKEHCWGSCIRYVDPTSMETMSCFELEGNEAAIRYF